MFERRLAGLAALLVFLAADAARAGVIDLRTWNFQRDGVVDLAGEWDFVRERFEEPGSAAPAPGRICRASRSCRLSHAANG